jgi:hypothetical protein
MSETTDSPTGDRMIAESEEAEMEANRAQKAANLFDLRRIIAGLFLIYGVILTVVGINASQKAIDKAAGVNVNLYTGLAMIAVAILFLIWAFTRPLSKQLEEAEREKEEMERQRGGSRFESGNGSTTSRDGELEPAGGRSGDDDESTVGSRAAGR